MDLLSLLGLILGAGFIVVSILLGEDPTTGAQTLLPEQLSGFWDLPSVMIVFGGTIASLMISFPLKSFAKIPKHLKIIFAPKKYNPQNYIEQIVYFAKEARINGLLAL